MADVKHISENLIFNTSNQMHNPWIYQPLITSMNEELSECRLYLVWFLCTGNEYFTFVGQTLHSFDFSNLALGMFRII